MQKRLAIGTRLKELRKQNKYSQQFVAENLFITQAAYSLIENSQNGLVAEHIINLSNLYDVTTDYILKGDKLLVKTTSSSGFVPFISRKAHAGYVKNFDGELMQEEYEWYRIPGYNPTKDFRLFEVVGHSMVPTVLEGDILICQKQQDINKILDGSLVCIITKDSFLVKRLRTTENPEVFNFENDNSHNQEILRFLKNQIKEILIVRGKISNVLIPHYQMASNGKIQAMEDSINFLKSELYAITQKLESQKK